MSHRSLPMSGASMGRHGVTLLELLIVVVILGVVSSLAIMRWRGSSPGFTFAECQYRRVAERTLRSMLSAERSYRQAELAFTDNLNNLPITDVNSRAAEDFPLAYDLVGTTATIFQGTARYTRRAGLAITLTYDAARPAEPRETLLGGATWCP